MVFSRRLPGRSNDGTAPTYCLDRWFLITCLPAFWKSPGRCESLSRSCGASRRQRVEVVEQHGDAPRIPLVHHLAREPCGGQIVEVADALLDAGQGVGGHAELVDAEAEQQRRELGIAGDLAAHA